MKRWRVPPRNNSEGASRQASLTRLPAAYLVPIIYAATLLLFITDLFRADVLAFGLFYTPMVATAVFYKRRSSVWVLSALAIGMVIIGGIYPTVADDAMTLIVNRALSVLAIIATAIFIQYARDVQDRLAAQAKRIEAAERIKSEILSNLSQEMRTPIHGLLSILELLVATSSNDQREALAKVRSGARHLLQNITNIIDLTALDGRPLQAQPIDLRSMGRQAVDQALPTARERQITLKPPAEGEPLLARGDVWATHRIMENLLIHAIAATPAGGLVALNLGHGPGVVTAAVSEAAPGLRTALAEDPATPDGLQSGLLGTGLILVCRLAAAMGGEVAALEQLGSRTLLQVSLPAAIV